MNDVSRETGADLQPHGTPPVPPLPEEARGVFPSDRQALATEYATSLATDGVTRGLIGPREVPRLWTRHLVNCALLAPLIPARAEVCDVGSGAGLPGLVLAIARPDLAITLVEPLLRRTTYLDEVTRSLGLTNVEVVRGRADSVHGKRRFDVVTSRAVAPLPRLLDWSMPLVRPHGELVAMKGSQVFDEIALAGESLARWGCREPLVEELAVPDGEADDSIGAGEGASSLQRSDVTYALRVSWSDPDSVRSTDALVRDPKPQRSRSGSSARGGSARKSRRR